MSLRSRTYLSQQVSAGEFVALMREAISPFFKWRIKRDCKLSFSRMCGKQSRLSFCKNLCFIIPRKRDLISFIMKFSRDASHASPFDLSFPRKWESGFFPLSQSQRSAYGVRGHRGIVYCHPGIFLIVNGILHFRDSSPSSIKAQSSKC